ncbi:MAG: metal ABC transporter ATP-binding protein [Anaerolineae bacterium]|nr:metal ABC transporter ATP-binding protein [Anaerolineae bacterium]
MNHHPRILNPLPASRGEICPALVIHELSAGYPGARSAIADISFTVQPGERVAVLGPNGAGKSTLFKAIVGLIPHHSGYVSMYGEECATSHQHIGYVPQQEAIDWRFPVTVGDVVMMGRARQIGWLRWPRKQDWEAVDAQLNRVGMLAFKHRQIGQLSGGQRRRVFIARALAQQTTVLLLDEPLSGVDMAAGEEIMGVLDMLHRDGVTIVLATHDMGMASTRFDRLLLVNQRVIAYGPAHEVFTAEALSRAYEGQVGIIKDGEKTVLIVDEHGHGIEAQQAALAAGSERE